MYNKTNEVGNQVLMEDIRLKGLQQVTLYFGIEIELVLLFIILFQLFFCDYYVMIFIIEFSTWQIKKKLFFPSTQEWLIVGFFLTNGIWVENSSQFYHMFFM